MGRALSVSFAALPAHLARGTYLVERLGEELCPAAVRDVAVPGVVAEELGLLVELLVHRLVLVDVRLAAVHHADEAQLERVHPPGEDVERVRASVHEVQLRQHSDRAAALRVDLARELERLRVGDVDVRGRDGEDDAAAPD